MTSVCTNCCLYALCVCVCVVPVTVMVGLTLLALAAIDTLNYCYAVQRRERRERVSDVTFI